MWYQGSFAVAVALAFGLYVFGRERRSAAKSVAFVSFQRNYLLVYLLAMFADWLQGPYIYKLYVDYGYPLESIAQLFVGGFLSSMLVGTFVGALADKYGRRRMCLLYAVGYIIAACTKLVNHYWVLMCGRIISGIATSLLFSAFESWMVCEHNKRGFEPELLGDTFGLSTLGNGLVAVFAGLVAEMVAAQVGSVGPFLFSILPLTLLLAVVWKEWPENYGDSHAPAGEALRQAWDTVVGSGRVLSLGAAQACFEGAMYTFVFMWTPTLDPTIDDGKGGTLPLGVIFAVFMVCMMAGSFAFKLMTRRGTLEHVSVAIHVVAVVAMATVVSAVQGGHNYSFLGLLDREGTIYIAFLAFQFTTGMFFPAYGTIRSAVVPERIRAAVMNLFRIPLNGFVVLLLLKVKYFPTATIFGICTLAHIVALVLYLRFVTLPTPKGYTVTSM